MTDILDLLQRDDKWFLGHAPGLLYAPPAPVWLGYPGFWDAAYYLHFPVEAVFTFTLLDDTLTPIALQAAGRSWRPDRLDQGYRAAGLRLRETRTCGPADVLASVLEIENVGDSERQLTLLAWTAQPVTDATLEDADARGGAVYIRREAAGLRNTKMSLTLALGLKGARSHNIHLSEAATNQPHFHLTPYYETLHRDGLDNRVILTGVNRTGLVYTALEHPLNLAPGKRVTLTIAAAVAPDTGQALAQLSAASGPGGRSSVASRTSPAPTPT